MRIDLDKPARDAAMRALSGWLRDELDVEIGGMDALRLLDFVSERLGPHWYNQALQDAREHLAAKVEALGEAFYELEKPAG